MTTRKAPVLAAHARLAAAIMMALCASQAAVYAQGQQQAAEIDSFRLPGWSFTPSVAAGVLHDSNVALAVPRASVGETQGDTLFNIVPSGRLEFLGRRTQFSASYRGFLRRHMEVDGLDGFDQRASAGVTRGVTRRLSVFAQNSFTDAPTTDDVEVNGAPFRRTGARTNTFAAGADYRLSRRSTLTSRYLQTWVAFDRPDLFLTGGRVHGLLNQLGYQLSERLSLGGEYAFRTASLNEGSRDLSFHEAGGVLRLTVGPHTTGSAAAGFSTLHDRTADVTRTGPYVRLGITHELRHATLGAGFERQFVPTFGFGGATNSRQLRGYVLMPLGRTRVYTQTSATWGHSVPFEQDVLELDTITLRSTVGYAFTRWARGEALYPYTRQDSIITGGEVDRHRIGVQFVVAQPMRIR
jgi:hypothetical protein